MAIELSKQEEKSFSDLNDNIKSRLREYKEKKSELTKEELTKELQDLNDYLEGCRNSEIDDLEINIRFCEGKANIIENLSAQYTCPHCGKKYPVPPKACSCETFEIIEETKYYYLETESNIDESKSVSEIGREISKEEFSNPTQKGCYIEETYIPGIETIGTFRREIKKIG